LRGGFTLSSFLSAFSASKAEFARVSSSLAPYFSWKLSSPILKQHKEEIIKNTESMLKEKRIITEKKRMIRFFLLKHQFY
jgi:hypothetical protein